MVIVLKFNDFFAEFCDLINRTGLFHQLCEEFNALKTNLDRIEYISQFNQSPHSLVLNQSPHRLELNLKTSQNAKCDLKSKAACEAGEKILLVKEYVPLEDLQTALMKFNEALAYCNRGISLEKCTESAEASSPQTQTNSNGTPVNNKPYALILGSRADCLLAMGRYSEAIADADLALSYLECGNDAYSSVKVKCLALQKLHRYEEAVKILGDIKAKHSKSRMLDDLYGDLLNNAEQQLKRDMKLRKKGVVTSDVVDFSARTSEWNPVPPIEHRNPKIPCASALIELSYDEQRRKTVVAAQDIEPDDVLVVESTVSYGLFPEYFVTNCYYCLKATDILFPCHQCATVRYCSEDCRLSSWSTTHAAECSLLGCLIDDGDESKCLVGCVRGMLPIGSQKLYDIFKVLKEGTPEDLVFSDLDPEPHPENWAFDVFKYTVYSFLFTEALEQVSCFFRPLGLDSNDLIQFKIFVGSLALKNLLEFRSFFRIKQSCIVNKNAGLHQDFIGFGTYTFSEMLDHSCAPNTCWNSHCDKIVIRASQSIKKGHLITIDNFGCNYSSSTLQERRVIMLSDYKFHCVCVACSSDWPVASESLGFSAGSGFMDDIDPTRLTAFGIRKELIPDFMSEYRSLKSLRKEVKLKLESFTYDDDTLKYVKEHIKLLEKYLKPPNHAYIMAYQCISMHFALKGNFCPPVVNSMSRIAELKKRECLGNAKAFKLLKR